MSLIKRILLAWEAFKRPHHIVGVEVHMESGAKYRGLDALRLLVDRARMASELEEEARSLIGQAYVHAYQRGVTDWVEHNRSAPESSLEAYLDGNFDRIEGRIASVTNAGA